MRQVLVVGALVSSMLVSVASAAGDPAADARARFTAGAQAYRESRYKDAIALFLEANRLDPHPALVFNIGQAFEKLGDVPSALRSYRDYLRLSPDASDRATVEASIRNLESRLRAKGVQQVSVLSTPAGATVSLDRAAVGATPWTGELTPGKHVVVLRSRGYQDTTKEFVLSADRSMDIDVTLSSEGAAPVAALPMTPAQSFASTAAPAPPESAPLATPARHDGPSGGRGLSSVRPWTWGALGIGVAGLAAALGLELSRRGAEDDARAEPTQVGFADKYDSMEGRQTAARVFLGIGAAATATGGALLAFDLWPRKGDAAPRPTVGCAGSACGLFASGSF